jgi:hypothetical protein
VVWHLELSIDKDITIAKCSLRYLTFYTKLTCKYLTNFVKLTFRYFTTELPNLPPCILPIFQTCHQVVNQFCWTYLQAFICCCWMLAYRRIRFVFGSVPVIRYFVSSHYYSVYEQALERGLVTESSGQQFCCFYGEYLRHVQVAMYIWSTIRCVCVM